jgi:hypothetical protein
MKKTWATFAVITARSAPNGGTLAASPQIQVTAAAMSLARATSNDARAGSTPRPSGRWRRGGWPGCPYRSRCRAPGPRRLPRRCPGTRPGHHADRRRPHTGAPGEGEQRPRRTPPGDRTRAPFHAATHFWAYRDCRDTFCGGLS